ncbi:hypothetical protein JOB18_041818 [Solea senegalensis]|uniref:Uncharacterized protein n=1 Tax=Solea senegalensis TaxID=28829 RepID=A0AAV6SIF8_SOLSE|nr:hypothetical protein JOB18_041818 [Solea senegalensis]
MVGEEWNVRTKPGKEYHGLQISIVDPEFGHTLCLRGGKCVPNVSPESHCVFVPYLLHLWQRVQQEAASVCLSLWWKGGRKGGRKGAGRRRLNQAAGAQSFRKALEHQRTSQRQGTQSQLVFWSRGCEGRE